jgi:hypothetical protein
MNETLTAVLSTVGAVGGLCGLGSVWYSRRQVKILEGQISKQAERTEEYGPMFQACMKRFESG